MVSHRRLVTGCRGYIGINSAEVLLGESLCATEAVILREPKASGGSDGIAGATGSGCAHDSRQILPPPFGRPEE